MRIVVGAVLSGLLSPAVARAACDTQTAAPERRAVSVVTPTLFIAWMFDRSSSGYVGVEAGYLNANRFTVGGYLQALWRYDRSASGTGTQLGLGATGGPWPSHVTNPCNAAATYIDARPLARLGLAYRARDEVLDGTLYAQMGASVSAVVGVVLSVGLPLSGARSRGLQATIAFTLSAPIVIAGREPLR